MRVPEKNAPVVNIPMTPGNTLLTKMPKRSVNMGAPTFNLKATGDSFQSGVDLRPLNAGINDLARAVAAGSMDLMAKKAETDANNAFATLNSELTEYLHGENGAYSRKGINAVGVVNDVGAFIEKRKRLLTQEMNKATKQMFEPRAMQLHVSMQKTLATYEDSERSQALFESRKAAVVADVNLIKNNPLDTWACEEAMGRIQATAGVMVRSLGLDETATNELIRKAVSESLRDRAVALVDVDFVYQAYEFLKDKRLNPDDRQTLRQRIKEKMAKDGKALAALNPAWGRQFAQIGISRFQGGDTRGYRNNNPLNLRLSEEQWKGKIPGGDGEFEVFKSPEEGVSANVKNIFAKVRRGKPTISSIIGQWAPSNENDTNAYIARVAKDMGVGPDDELDLKDPDNILNLYRSMAAHENKNLILYSNEQMMAGILDAMGVQPLPKDAPRDPRNQLAGTPDGLMDLADFVAIDAVAEKSARAAQKQFSANAVSAAYNQAWEQTRELPEEDRDLAMAEAAQSLPDANMRKLFWDSYAEDQKILKTRQGATDAKLRLDVLQRTQGMKRTDILRELSTLRNLGMSEKALSGLEKEITEGPTYTDPFELSVIHRGILNGAYDNPGDLLREMDDKIIASEDRTKMHRMWEGLQDYKSLGFDSMLKGYTSNLEALGVSDEGKPFFLLGLNDMLRIKQEELGRRLTRVELDDMIRSMTMDVVTSSGIFSATREPAYRVLPQIPAPAQEILVQHIKNDFDKAGYAGPVTPYHIVREWLRKDNEPFRSRHSQEARLGIAAPDKDDPLNAIPVWDSTGMDAR